ADHRADGACDGGDRARCLEAGMDAYLTKPVQPAMLLRAIGRPDRYSELAATRVAPRIVLDRAELVDRVDGDPQLLEEIVKLFFDNHGRLMAEAKNAMIERNAEGFAIALHTLLGWGRAAVQFFPEAQWRIRSTCSARSPIPKSRCFHTRNW